MHIISPWKDRLGYVTIMLATLKEAMRGHDDVHVTLYNNESQCQPPSICDDFGDDLSHVLMKSRVNPVSHSAHHLYIDMLDYQFDWSDEKFVVTIDSDCCVHPEFIDAAKQMIIDLPQLGHASLYSEGNHPEPTEFIDEIYHVREHISMTASIVNRDLWEIFPKPKAENEIRAFWEPYLNGSPHAGGIDGALSTFAHQQSGFGCYSTVRSYVDHIGAIGLYSDQDAGGSSSAHRARRFNP